MTLNIPNWKRNLHERDPEGIDWQDLGERLWDDGREYYMMVLLHSGGHVDVALDPQKPFYRTPVSAHIILKDRKGLWDSLEAGGVTTEMEEIVLDWLDGYQGQLGVDYAIMRDNEPDEL